LDNLPDAEVNKKDEETGTATCLAEDVERRAFEF
jgi:hypothetical protein